jgi:hypothetical protein
MASQGKETQRRAVLAVSHQQSAFSHTGAVDRFSEDANLDLA